MEFAGGTTDNGGFSSLLATGPLPTQAGHQPASSKARRSIKRECLQLESAKFANTTPHHTKNRHVAIRFAGNGFYDARNPLCLRVSMAPKAAGAPSSPSSGVIRKAGQGGVRLGTCFAVGGFVFGLKPAASKASAG